MKITTAKPQFTPVVITLETQEEVDQMHAMLRADDVCPAGSPLGPMYSALHQHSTPDGSDHYYHAMRARIRDAQV